ncbi:MAG: hypothetical protein JW791_04480 [Nanoarchaeota archaeon]|nr:hypothetical protein [Nanoarchaeota archaeon]
MYFKQKFEPKKGVIHGAGQEGTPFNYPVDFKDYWDSVGENKPLLFMTYIQLKWINKKWFELTKKQVKYFPNIILQIGLSISDTHSGEPEKHYEQDVLSGKFDKNIQEFCQEVKKLKSPVFVRLGYEFNGLSWYGYQPNSFVKAWRYVIDKVKKDNVNNVAWVWHYSPEGEKNYMDYYPGDDYVNWWGTTLFFMREIEKSKKFLKDAENHKKPVMICESSAVNVTTLKGEDSWREWFKPYFNYIKTNPIIKAFCYINGNWAEKEKIWKEWGECRISKNKTVMSKYKKELENKIYIHNKDYKKIK